jgi:hypothetical protein
MCRIVEIIGRAVKLGLVALMILKLGDYGVQQLHGIRSVYKRKVSHA